MAAPQPRERQESEQDRTKGGGIGESEASLLEKECGERGHPPSCLMDGQCVCGANRYD